MAWIEAGQRYPAFRNIVRKMPKKADFGIGAFRTLSALVYLRRIGLSNVSILKRSTNSLLLTGISYSYKSASVRNPNRAPLARAIVKRKAESS